MFDEKTGFLTKQKLFLTKKRIFDEKKWILSPAERDDHSQADSFYITPLLLDILVPFWYHFGHFFITFRTLFYDILDTFL